MIGLLAAVFVVVAGCTSPAATTPSPRRRRRARPNFVFVLTDDLSWNLVSHMPNLVALQQAGTTMSRYYVVDSLCCPSRSAIFTGQYPHDDGVFTNAGNDGGYFAFNQHGDQQKSFALALHEAGYRTALMGKYLNQYQPAYPEPPGWDEWDAAGNAYGEFGYNLNQNGRQQHYGSDPQDYLTDVLAAKASSFIDSSAASGRPFMLEVATFAPHAPYTPAPRYAHADQQLTDPKTPAYDRLPVRPAAVAEGPPAAVGHRSGQHHHDVPQAGGGRSLRRRHDRRARERTPGQGPGPEHVLRVQLGQRLPHGRVQAAPRASRPPSRPTSACR